MDNSAATRQTGLLVMESSNICGNIPSANCNAATIAGSVPVLPMIQCNTVQMAGNTRQRSVQIDSLIKQFETAEAVAAEARKRLQPFLESDKVQNSQKRRITQALNDGQGLQIDSIILKLEDTEMVAEAQERLLPYLESDRIRDSQKRRIIHAINDAQQRLHIDSLIQRLENVELAIEAVTETQERLLACLELDGIPESRKLRITQALNNVPFDTLIKQLETAETVASAREVLWLYLESFRTQGWQRHRIVQAFNKTANAMPENRPIQGSGVFRLHGPRNHSLIKAYNKLHGRLPMGLLALDLTEDGRLNSFISGPESSIFSQAFFKLELSFPSDYPFRPPKATFRTRIFHPNVDERTGSVCLDILQDQWSPVLSSLEPIIVSIQSILDDPAFDAHTESANVEAAQLWLNDKQEYERRALETIKESWKLYPFDAQAPLQDGPHIES